MRKTVLSLTVLAATALTGLAVPAAQAASCGRDATRAVAPGTLSPSGVYVRSASERRAPRVTVCLINNQRAAAGLPALRSNALLAALAGKHSRDLATNGYADPSDPHVGSDGSTIQSRLLPYSANFGASMFKIAETVTESSNSSPAQAVRWWMNSPGHRAILLDAELEEVGVGMQAKRPGGASGATYTADFGTARN